MISHGKTAILEVAYICLSVNLVFVQCLFLTKIRGFDGNEREFYTEKCHDMPKENDLIFANYNPLNWTQTKRQVTYETFLIHTHYHNSFDKLPDDTYSLYKNKLIPEAIDFWQKSLRVKYPYRPILLGRSCPSSQVYYALGMKTVSCDNNCLKSTKCGDLVVVPDEHLDVCRYCSSPNNCREGQKIPNTTGINADFILYISAVNTEHCDVSNTVAFASYCQLESKYNRPVAGYVNICPQSVSAKQSDMHSILATLQHEILHALGFSAGLYAFFVDSNGKPLTQRDPSTGKPLFNQKTSTYEPSEKIVRKVKRKNWQINEGMIERDVTLMVTPKVVQEARQHFDCAELEGAELEDQGDIGTKYTHWEKRLFENEAMTGTYTQNSVFSRITFAFLEDTGWYTANYSYAEDLKWGKHLGCDFAMKSCKSWIDDRQSKGLSIRPYCNSMPQATDNHAKYECNSNRDAVLLCNLVRYSTPIPVNYRKNMSGADMTEFIGGSVVLADFCPFMQQVSWSVNNEVVRDSKCIYEENRPEKQKNYALEDYGSDSRCMLHNHTWHIYSHGCQSRTIVSKTVGCYKHMCVEGLGLVIQIDNKEFLCSFESQLIEFTIVNKYKIVHFGNIICPACDEICQNKIQCPNEGSNVKKVSNDFQSQSRHHQKLCYQQLNKSSLSFIALKLLFFVWLLLFALLRQL